MSDNHKAYTSDLFTGLLDELGAREILTPAYTPRWNGKIERFFGTARREWSHSRVWPNSSARDRALSSFIRFYNRRRPHSAAAGRPPISRVHHVHEQDRLGRRDDHSHGPCWIADTLPGGPRNSAAAVE